MLSTVLGFLQPLTPATSGNIGAALLWYLSLYLHNLPHGTSQNTKQAYFYAVLLSPRS